MAITVLPQRKSGLEQFNEGISPYLQLAMQAMMNRKLKEQEYHANLQRSMQMQPELFAPSPQMVSAPQGMGNMPGAVGGQLPVKSAIPTSYQFLQNKAQPGQEFNATTGELSFKKSTPDIFTKMVQWEQTKGGGMGGQGIPQTADEAIKTALTQNPEYNAADVEVNPIYDTIQGIKKIAGYEAKISSQAKQLKSQQLKKKDLSMKNFEIARNKLRVTASAYKAMREKAGGSGFKAASQAAFGGTTLGRMMGTNPYSKAYEGQLVEAASSLAKLAAPSARVGQEIIAQFKKTLPDVWSIANPGEFQNQIRFSLHNAFSTALADSGEAYTPDIRNMVDKMVDDIVNVPTMDLEDLNKLNRGQSIDESKYVPQNSIQSEIDDIDRRLKELGGQ